MILYCILSVFVFFGVFVLFLVISKTLNNILNNLIKMQYLLQKDLDQKKEHFIINKLMDEEKIAAQPAQEPENRQEKKPLPNGKPGK
jgi:predicted PurR-regulated permease PerM